MFSAPEMLSKALGCSWLLLAAPAAQVTLKIQNSKFGRADARLNLEFCGTGRPGRAWTTFSRPGRKMFAPGARNICGQGAKMLRSGLLCR